MLKNSKKYNKGISSVIGTVIFVSILLLIVTLVGWMINEFNTYNTASQKRSEFDWEKESEEIVITKIEIDDEINSFFLTIRNKGGVSAQIDTIWLLTSSMHYSYSTYIMLNPGSVVLYTFTPTDVTLDPTGNYSVKVVTTRGNIVSVHYPMIIPGEGVGSGEPSINVGPLRLEIVYEQLKYTSETQHSPIPGWKVPPGERLIFWVKITNTGNDVLKLLRQSLFYAIEYQSGMSGSAQKAWSFFIVDPDSTYPPGGVIAYNEIVNPYYLYPNPDGDWVAGGPPVTVKFSSQYMGQTGANQFPAQGGYYLISIGLYFEYQGDEMGINIPFVAIRTIGL